jgi:hypothetical protein
VIGKISVPRGEHVEPLLYYLFGPGRHEEHTDPHVIAGWRYPAALEPPLRADGRREFTTLAGLLKQPQAALGDRGYARPVWHCAMRAAPEDKMLSDDEWARIAHEVMHRTGLAPSGHDDDAVRWIAVRHGPDHIHLVAMLARQDGGKPSLSHERYKVRAACLAAEQRYGLRSTAPADRTAARRPTRAETEKAARHRREEAPRVTLRRHVTTAAASAASEQDFFARLGQAGLQVRTRVSVTDPGQVTGYAVALPGDITRDGGPVWYGGGKLAPDLTWAKLRQRWAPPRVTPGREPMNLTAAERNAIWDHAARVTADAATQIRHLAGTNPAAAADAAWATSDTLHVAAAMLGSGILRQAADAYDRAARAPYGRIPPPTPAGNQLRQAARLLAAFAHLSGDRSLAPVVLITRLAALAEAVAELRDAQQHAAQAAAEHLYAAARPALAPRPRTAPPTRTAAQIAALSFPKPFKPGKQPLAPGQPGPTPPPPRRPPPPRPRGPGR